MTVVLIIGILLSIAYVAYAQSTQSAASAACRSNQRVLEDAYVQAVAAFKRLTTMSNSLTVSTTWDPT
jgi:Tfp pilus assembly protein PilE